MRSDVQRWPAGWVWAAGLLLFLTTCPLTSRASDAASRPQIPGRPHSAVRDPYPHRTKLPDDFFEGGAGWLNVSGPIELRDLRGKIVVVDFWTYCCINCMHVLPDLKYLEHKYPRDLVVIGVHSAKFENERDSENIRRAILRYNIEHPVVNDSRLTIWRRAGVNAWPTLAIIDPEGRFVGSVSGEGQRAVLDEAIGKLVEYHKATGTLDESPLRLGLERRKAQPTPLDFPGKVLADEATDRLFVADSDHNRIVISTLAGKLVDVAGDGRAGAQNGPFAGARFQHPQGMAAQGTHLYVADTENHLIRDLDLLQRSVSTLAGTGQQDVNRSTGGRLRQTPLNSPWDLVLVNRVLYVAMAGDQRIWAHVLGSDDIRVFAGNGREDVINGTRAEAAFAQPSGLTTDGTALYVADSEGSAIRKIPLDGPDSVTTVAGTSDLEMGRSLFEFGDHDAVGKSARFQHPLGVAYHAGSLYVADSYNHKIRVINLKHRDVKTWLGNGKRGDALEPAQFSEPAGLSIVGDSLYIADTNNQAIKVADLRTRQVRRLPIDGLTPPSASDAGAAESADEPPAQASGEPALEPQRVAPASSLQLQIALKFGEGYGLNKGAPATCRVRVESPNQLFPADTLAKSFRAEARGGQLIVKIPMAAVTGKAVLDCTLSFTYCREGVGGLCKLGKGHWTIPIEVATDAQQTAVQLAAAAGSK